MASGTSRVDIRRADDRGASTTDWLQSRHSFSFADYYDPANTHHGLLLVNNDDVVAPGSGFDTHPHRDMEIVTWVLSGQLAHEDSMGNSGVIYPGLAQRMSAGTGVQHSEKNGSAREPVHFVQMWVLPDTAGLTPSYQQQEVDLANTLTPIASGAVDAAVTLHNRDATLYGARLRPGDSVELPRARFVHLFVARGSVTLEGAGPLAEGDAARLTDSGGRVTTDADAEILVWEMNAGLGGA
ncbi:pirin family protein [Mycolicibacterium porcinum]|uniref:Pirin family protein n=1 Tax=Mycolicibacterium porcinum TaxID=39693 RepID=A0AAW5SVT9_9MYCO|nr:pirin-like bicupin family protein [Mycolicibacterium porcinum]MBX8688407.1 pirin family protein [Mycobacterium sp. 20091114027_K0903767]CDO30629.1 Pirin-like protein [Mycolicibacterium vulneris]MCV7386695.1 pirin family protein [Mycolicibacterium porcinum]ODR18355.1 quercetin 2,3-dioxygenase [Mycolicibacterium porcinum]ORB33820.1 quercetin 2,3-dioxygenase [Mycolicibacterium porcinum]